jgi:hypothetical protein
MRSWSWKPQRWVKNPVIGCKMGYKAPNWFQVINERLKWLYRESSRILKFKERRYLEKIIYTPQEATHKDIHTHILLNIFYVSK